MYIYRKYDRFQITERQNLVNADFVTTTETRACGNTLCPEESYTIEYYVLRPGLTLPNATFLTNQDTWRTFNGFEVAARKRYSDRWLMNTSFALNSALNYWGTGEYAFVDPTNVAQRHGRDALAQNARWVFKLNGMYSAPYGINLSAFFNAREGFPYNPTVQTSSTRGSLNRVNVFVEPLGTQRLDDYFQTDVRVEKSFQLRKFSLSAAMDVFNLLNENAVLGRETSYISTRATFVNEIMAPRVIRFGVRVKY